MVLNASTNHKVAFSVLSLLQIVIKQDPPVYIFNSQNSAIENELAEIVGLAFGVIMDSLETMDNMSSMTRCLFGFG